MSLAPHFGCDRCYTLIRVIGKAEEIQSLIYNHQWKDGYPCVTAGCEGNMHEVDQAFVHSLKNTVKSGLITFYTLNPKEFFSALCGFGLPDEIGCAPEIVKAMLLSARVSDVGVRESSSGRTILDRIFLDNKTCIHLAASPSGPCVFKITRVKDEDLECNRDGLLSCTKGHDVLREDESFGDVCVGGGGERGYNSEGAKQEAVHGGAPTGDGKGVTRTSGKVSGG